MEKFLSRIKTIIIFIVYDESIDRLFEFKLLDQAFADDGDTVITSGYFETRMLKTDKIFKSLFFTEITISKGKIVKYRLLEDSFGLVLALS
ncbi:hypothetical protein [Dyadobacter chenhuakuii]|uniref:Uncharacterized protein n=1 Tax=Dyadobacter chenhuakuii TaxID=2909339 RepID=A0ABY4XRB5_9BACT|nr:hypothetical protein [Dyadobacter chenhuakuii]MCF2492831.1 hypothetical protein [Dyadobacter chenhuakuii]USJ32879.1 hypothetical protein NFI80_09035 [Dyadobacter chenhuakuii]